jgi:hypothetical protein
MSQRLNELSKKYNAIRRSHAVGKTIDRLAKRHRVLEEAVKVAIKGGALSRQFAVTTFATAPPLSR